MKRVIWAVAFLAVLAGAGYTYQAGLLNGLFERGRNEAPTRPSQPAVPVKVAVVAVKPTPVEFDSIGTVQTIASVAVKSRLDAVIDKVLVQDGQFVKAGDVIFQLDARAAQAQVDQAAATLARDQAQLSNANRNVERDTPLVSKDFLSHQQFDTDSATAKALAATVQADQAQLENAKVMLTYYTIVAPIDGRVGAIAIKQGNSIKSNDVPLATVNQIQPIYVSFALPQNQLPELRAAMALGAVPVSVLGQGDKGAPVEGKVAFFDNAIDTTSGTINVRATFANDEQRLWPGEFVNVSVRCPHRSQRHRHSARRRPGRPERHLRLRHQGRRHRRNAPRHGRPDGRRPSRHQQGTERRRASGDRRAASSERRRPRPDRRRRAAKAGWRVMTLPELCIRRPVMTTLLMLAFVIFGLFSYRLLPVAAVPRVDFPTIVVNAQLPGASPETMASSVATPLEKQFSTIAGVNAMISSSGEGITSITMQFDLDRNIDGAALGRAVGLDLGGQAPADPDDDAAELPSR